MLDTTRSLWEEQLKLVGELLSELGASGPRSFEFVHANYSAA